MTVGPGELALAMLVLVPLVGAAASLVAGPRRAQVGIVGATSAVLVLASVLLLGELAGRGFALFEVAVPDELGLLVQALGFVLAAVFLYFAWVTRSVLVAAFAIADLVVLSLFLALPSPTGPALLVDNLSLILILITSMVGSLIVIYSLRYMREDERRGRFFAVMLLFLGAMNAAVVCNDLLWLELFWGVTTLCSFLLIGHTRTAEAKKAARWALIVNLGGGVALIVGSLLSHYYYGTFELSEIPVGGAQGLALLPLVLLAIGSFTKSAQVPFQSWLLGAMVAPTPVSALLHSSTMVNLGVYLLLRLSPSLQGTDALAWTVALVGAVSFLATSVLAMTQSNSKRVLAYSTIGNLGLIVMCAGIATPLAVTAAVVLLLYHAISKALLFLTVGVIKEGRGSEDIEDMHGLRMDMPVAALALFIGVATLVLPPFGMFVAKWLISEAVITFPFLVFLLAVGFASIVVYYFKWIGVIVSSGAAEGPRSLRHDTSPRLYRWTLGTLAGGAVLLSVLVGPVVEYLVRPFIERHFMLPVSTDNLSLFTSLGEFPVFLFLVLGALVFLGLGLFVRPRKEERSIPYAGGETFEFQAGGEYYLSERWTSLAGAAGTALGAGLLAAMLVLPVLLEVL